MNKNLFTISGEVIKNGKLCYIPQSSFILNATIKDNIVFGREFKIKRFKKVIEICQLKADLDLFPSGIHTEIGE